MSVAPVRLNPRDRTAFVLSGGGSLGAMQVGMLQALMEARIRPDLLIGTSVGAVNAAWIAGRPDHDGALELGEIWRGLRRQDIFPLSPWAGACGLLGRSKHLVSNTGLRSVLERHLRYEQLEDAEVPVHVVTTDLKTGRAVMLSSGPAVPALLASTAIPGVFPPVLIGRREHVDGGVANHTPVAAAIELGATRVYVLPIAYPWLRREPTNALGMAFFALSRFIEQRLDAEVAAHRHLAEIHVLPACELPSASPADFSRTQELMTRGYRSTRRFLASTPDRPPLQPLRLAPAAARAA
jgi:NTE family protein